MKRKRIFLDFIRNIIKRDKEETTSVSDRINDRINELKSYRFYLTYIIDNDLIGKQINQDELQKRLVITEIKNRK